MALFDYSLHHPIISLFSSTGSDPLALFLTQTDSETAEHSSICLLHDARSGLLSAPMHTKIPLLSTAGGASDSQGHQLDQTVLHIQSPDLRRTYIQTPPNANTPRGSSPTSGQGSLGIRHPWIHLQVRNLGKDWSFEVGLVDTANRMGTLRLSTFQVRSDLE